MAKNAFAKRLTAEKERDRIAVQRVTRQMTLDMAQITLGRMGFGAKRQSEFHTKFTEVFIEYCDLFNSDVRDDPEIVYAKSRMDRELAEYCGENFSAWEERYK